MLYKYIQQRETEDGNVKIKLHIGQFATKYRW